MRRYSFTPPVLAMLIAFAAYGDLELNPGTRIVFGDGTSQSSALQTGLSLPAGHGGADNTVAGANSFIGGGRNNATGADYATVSGGGDADPLLGNVITDNWGTIGGGRTNQAGDDAGTTSDRPYATVAGGHRNTASGFEATVCGGYRNTASGSRATVAGGGDNYAFGSYSFAAGRNANATHSGSFVWGDYDADTVSSSAINQFKARAQGGFVFVTSTPLGIEQGATLPSGASSWESLSSRETKSNGAAVDSVEVLEKLAEMPIERWNYWHQDRSTQHIGPYAEDFHKAFGLNGEYRGTISTQDAEGVALAAIQGLNRKLESQLAAKQERIDELEARLIALELRLGGDQP